MKVYVVMISPDEPPQQQMQMYAEAVEVWFNEQDADDRIEQLNDAREDEIRSRHYWVDKVPLRIKDEQ